MTTNTNAVLHRWLGAGLLLALGAATACETPPTEPPEPAPDGGGDGAADAAPGDGGGQDDSGDGGAPAEPDSAWALLEGPRFVGGWQRFGERPEEAAPVLVALRRQGLQAPSGAEVDQDDVLVLRFDFEAGRAERAEVRAASRPRGTPAEQSPDGALLVEARPELFGAAGEAPRRADALALVPDGGGAPRAVLGVRGADGSYEPVAIADLVSAVEGPLPGSLLGIREGGRTVGAGQLTVARVAPGGTAYARQRFEQDPADGGRWKPGPLQRGTLAHPVRGRPLLVPMPGAEPLVAYGTGAITDEGCPEQPWIVCATVVEPLGGGEALLLPAEAAGHPVAAWSGTDAAGRLRARLLTVSHEGAVSLVELERGEGGWTARVRALRPAHGGGAPDEGSALATGAFDVLGNPYVLAREGAAMRLSRWILVRDGAEQRFELPAEELPRWSADDRAALPEPPHRQLALQVVGRAGAQQVVAAWVAGRGGRTGRNPQTGKEIKIPASRVDWPVDGEGSGPDNPDTRADLKQLAEQLVNLTVKEVE